LLDLEDVTERDAEQFKRAGKIELGEAMLLRGLLGLLLVPVEGQVIASRIPSFYATRKSLNFRFHSLPERESVGWGLDARGEGAI
jgi:hypothetical protein